MNPGGDSLPTGDASVDALVDLGAQVRELPAGSHKALYTRVLDGLERELDADPAAALSAAALSPAGLPAAEPPGADSGTGQAHDQA